MNSSIYTPITIIKTNISNYSKQQYFGKFNLEKRGINHVI